MKAAGGILLAIGFLSGSYMAVAQVDSVDWLRYGICAAIMIVGMVILRHARAEEARGAGEKHVADIETLRTSLASLIGKVSDIESASGDEEQLEVHHRIDAELMDDINSFVQARESMIPRFGMQRYADIMSPFANGERLLNRAWSASADGYVDEVRKCVQGARVELEKAAARIAEEAGSASDAPGTP